LHLITLCDTYTLLRTPLEEASARRRDLYQTTHNIQKIQAAMPLGVLERSTTAYERQQTLVIDLRKGKLREFGRNCIMRRCTICAPRQILTEFLNQGEWNGQVI
jgi:hypothetical protein